MPDTASPDASQLAAQAIAIATGKATYLTILGPKPQQAAERRAHEAARVKLHRAVAMAREVLAVSEQAAIVPATRGSEGWSFTPTGIAWSESTTQEEWKNLMIHLRDVKRKYHLYLGDALRYGRCHYGDAAVSETLTQLELSLDDIHRADTIAAVPEPITHTSQLTTEQAFILGRELEGKPESEFKKWAEIAIEGKMNPNLLARSIQAGKALSQSELDQKTGKGSGRILTIQNVMLQFQSWLVQVGGLASIKKWRKADKSALAQELAPIAELIDTL